MNKKVISSGIASTVLLTSLITTVPLQATQVNTKNKVVTENKEEKEDSKANKSNTVQTKSLVNNVNSTKQNTNSVQNGSNQDLVVQNNVQSNNQVQENTNNQELINSLKEMSTLKSEIAELYQQKSNFTSVEDAQKAVDEKKASLDALPYLALQAALDSDNAELEQLKLDLNTAEAVLESIDLEDEEAYNQAKLAYDTISENITALVEKIAQEQLTVGNAKEEYEKVLADYQVATNAYDEAVQRNAEIDQQIQDKTYKYVAIGDSVAAGYGLEGSSSLPGKGEFATELNANKLDASSEFYGVSGSYANLFGADLTNAINSNDPTYEVIAKNLGQPAYTSEDLLAALQGEPTGLTPYIQMLAETINGGELTDEQKAAVSAQYNESGKVIKENVEDANLISLSVGNNDMISSVLVPLYENQSNPLIAAVLSIAGGSIDLTGEGAKSTSDIYESVLNTLVANKDDITEENISQFINYLVSLPIDLLTTASTVVSNTKSIVNTIESQNSDAQIALLSLYYPFGNSINCEGVTYDMAYISRVIVSSIIETYASDCSIELPSIEEIMKMAEQLEDEKPQTVILDLAKDVNYLMQMKGKELTSDMIDKAKTLVDKISSRLAYIMNYETLGTFVNPYVDIINTGFKSIAAGDTKVMYVDITGIPNESDADPHPNKYGHAEIAKYMKDGILPYVHVPRDAVRETINGKEYDVVYCALHHDVISKKFVKVADKTTTTTTSVSSRRASSTKSSVNTGIESNVMLYSESAGLASLFMIGALLKKRKEQRN